MKAPVSNMNLFATILDYLEMPPRRSDGDSLRGLIEGSASEADTYVVTEWLSDLQGRPTHMILKGGVEADAARSQGPETEQSSVQSER